LIRERQNGGAIRALTTAEMEAPETITTDSRSKRFRRWQPETNGMPGTKKLDEKLVEHSRNPPPDFV
jgi:hypothetical protein